MAAAGARPVRDRLLAPHAAHDAVPRRRRAASSRSHDGETRRPPRRPAASRPGAPAGTTLEELYCEHANVLAHVSGHEHENYVERHDCADDSPPPPKCLAAPACPNPVFWHISTAAHIDYPQQARMIELVDDRGELKLVLTMLDHEGAANAGDGNARPTSSGSPRSPASSPTTTTRGAAAPAVGVRIATSSSTPTARPRARPHRIGPRMADTASKTQWVYDFADGSRDMRDLLGGKGANVAEMTRVLGAERVPAGFTITTEACVAYMKGGQEEPDGMADEVAEALDRLEEQAGQAARRRRRPAARLGALGRARVDARDARHGPQPRPQRRVGRGAGQADRERPLRVGLLPPLRADVRQRRARDARARSSRRRSRRPRRSAGSRTTPTSTPTTSRR